MALEDRYRVIHLAEAKSVSERDVLEFWDREGAMSPETARDRIREVAFVGLEKQEGVVAVSTVYLRRSPRLGLDLWHYRAFVGRRHRHSALAVNLTVRITDYLEEQFVSGRDPRGCGVIVEVEDHMLKTVKNEAVWPHKGFVFIGESPRGDHYRVYYFPGAVLPPPD